MMFPFILRIFKLFVGSKKTLRNGETIHRQEHRHGLAEMGLLLDRGLPPNTAPFGLTPLSLGMLVKGWKNNNKNNEV